MLLSIHTLCAAFVVVLIIPGEQASLINNRFPLVEARQCRDPELCPSIIPSQSGGNRLSGPFDPAGNFDSPRIWPMGQRFSDQQQRSFFAPDRRFTGSNDNVSLRSGRNININVLSNIPLVDIIRAYRGELPKRDSSEKRVTPPAWRPGNAVIWAAHNIPRYVGALGLFTG